MFDRFFCFALIRAACALTVSCVQYMENLGKSLAEGFNEEIASGGTPSKAGLKTSTGAKGAARVMLKPAAAKAAATRGKK